MSVNTDNSSIDTLNENKISKFLGQGTYGIIIGKPRLPSEGETYNDVLNSHDAPNQVSKIIKDNTDIARLSGIIDMINNRFNPSNLAQLQKQIVIPTRPQRINWHNLSFIPKQIEVLQSHKITKRKYKWQYLMERGTNDLDIELRSVKTLNQLKHFLKGFGNIINGIAELHKAGLVHTDIKLTNMIVSWDGKYKLIDLDELSDCREVPKNTRHFEKIFNNIYYPYYPPSSVFLHVLLTMKDMNWDKKNIISLFKNLITKNYDIDYHKYFNEITNKTLMLANDTELTNILMGPFINDQAMIDYLLAFHKLLITQPDNISAHRELLLFIDRYALGINLLILLGKYYTITGQVSGVVASDTSTCEFISQSLIPLIKLCCNTKNYSQITTSQIATEYNEFITQLYRSYPFKFIIKLLYGSGIRHKLSQV